jgi:hypothetical protein
MDTAEVLGDADELEQGDGHAGTVRSESASASRACRARWPW